MQNYEHDGPKLAANQGLMEINSEEEHGAGSLSTPPTEAQEKIRAKRCTSPTLRMKTSRMACSKDASTSPLPPVSLLADSLRAMGQPRPAVWTAAVDSGPPCPFSRPIPVPSRWSASHRPSLPSDHRLRGLPAVPAGTGAGLCDDRAQSVRARIVSAGRSELLEHVLGSCAAMDARRPRIRAVRRVRIARYRRWISTSCRVLVM